MKKQYAHIMIYSQFLTQKLVDLKLRNDEERIKNSLSFEILLNY